MSNKGNGSAFEREFAMRLSECGFWAHLLKDNHNGQPFDLIAAKNGSSYVFDCKDCKYERFSLSRIEQNQIMAMQRWWSSGNTEPLFAIQFPEKRIRILKFSTAISLICNGISAITGNKIMSCTIPFKDWMERV